MECGRYYEHLMFASGFWTSNIRWPNHRIIFDFSSETFAHPVVPDMAIENNKVFALLL